MFVCPNLFWGGVDTSSLTVNWAMAELVRNPRVMKKVQDEVRKCDAGQQAKELKPGKERSLEEEEGKKKAKKRREESKKM